MLKTPDIIDHDRPQATVPLCVDLDGTLLKTDTLLEGCLRLAQRRPRDLLLAPGWAVSGRARLKREVAARAPLDPSTLPYDERLLARLRDERMRGRRIVLVTGADRAVAGAVADHLGLFDEVMASEGDINLTGESKRDALVARFGQGGFDYAGNSARDLVVWRAARRALLVNGRRGLERRAAATAGVDTVLRAPVRTLATPLRAMRVRQWLKNLLVFAPIAAGHQLLDPGPLLGAAVAFIALSLAASAIYLVNDLLDLDADRRHPTKRERPLAAGLLPIGRGLVLAVALLLGALLVASALPGEALGALLVYLATTIAYSFWLKHKLLVDVFTLSLLYTLRIVLGAAATGILVSPWLLAFSIFLFLSLALSKRVAELARLRDEARHEALGRAYYVWDQLTLHASGVTSGVVAAAVLALYIQSDAVRELYRAPSWLWLLVPLILYWIARVWVLVGRGALNEDPVLFATRDRLTYLVIAAGAVIVALATSAPVTIPGLRP
jgi:4-hydroxybenzoate polyprenyltransferase/phosphoserine phosphatase